MVREGAAFVALLLLLSGVATVNVLPPTNVTVSCQNLGVTVRWKYNEQEPQTSFRVNIKGINRYPENITTHHLYDLTPIIWKSEKHYMDNFVVTVTAIQEGNQSEPQESKTFTFNNVKTADMRCKLDFPPVDLNVKDSGATVSFRNPFHYYGELKQARKSNGASFQFTVNSDIGAVQGSCSVKEGNCKSEISFPESMEKCVTLTGSLHDGIVGQVVFRKTNPICASESTEIHMITLVIVLCAIVLVITVIVIIICMTKAWTMDIAVELPSSLKPAKNLPFGGDPETNTDISVVAVTPLVCAKGENGPRNTLQDSRGLSESSSQSLESVGLISEGDRTDDDSAGAEEERKYESHYDCGHTLQVDMGDGDMVTTYN